MTTAVLDPLQAAAAEVSALRAEYDAQARQLSLAMKERDTAEKALLAAQQRVAQLDTTTSGISGTPVGAGSNCRAIGLPMSQTS